MSEGVSDHECFEMDGAMVLGDPNMSDESREAVRAVIAAARQRLAELDEGMRQIDEAERRADVIGRDVFIRGSESVLSALRTPEPPLLDDADGTRTEEVDG